MPKQSFFVFYDLEEQTKLLSDEQLGKLLRCMFEYEIHGNSPDITDAAVRMAFSFVKVSLRENKRKYTEKCKKLSENGRQGGRPSKQS